MIDANKTYTVAEASELAGVCGETIRLKIKNKKLVAARVDHGPWRVAGASLLNNFAPVLELQRVTVRTSREKNKRAHQLQ